MRIFKESGTISEVSTPLVIMDDWGFVNGKTTLLEIERSMNYVEFGFDISPEKEFLTGEIVLDFYIYIKRENELNSLVFEMEGLSYSDINLHYDGIINDVHPDTELVFKYYFRYKNAKEAIYYKTTEVLPKSLHKIDVSDQHLYVYRKVDTPELIIDSRVSIDYNGFKTESFITESDTTNHLLLYHYNKKDSPIVSVGGLTLTEELDYDIDENNLLTFHGTIHKDTVVNIVYTNTLDATGFKKFNNVFYSGDAIPKDKAKEASFILDGPTQGVFLGEGIKVDTTPLVFMGGMTLSETLDYTISDDKRYIYFLGEITNNSVITIYYIPEFGTLIRTDKLVSGLVKLPSQIFYETGYVKVEVSEDIHFTDNLLIVSMPYEDARFMYDFSIELPKGGTYFIRSVNEKILKTKNNEEIIREYSNGMKIIIE